jgi:hypothetical protein
MSASLKNPPFLCPCGGTHKTIYQLDDWNGLIIYLHYFFSRISLGLLEVMNDLSHETRFLVE